MTRTSLAMAAAAMIAALPAAAQQTQGGTAPPGREETVPLQLKAEQVAAMQQKLNERGFFAGRVDGLWGPDTSAAVRDFQQRNSLPTTGRLDPGTLQALGIVDAAASPAVASPAAAPSIAVLPATPDRATTAVPAPSSPSNTAAGPAMRGAPLGTGNAGPNLAAGVDPAAPAASVPDGTPGNPPGTAVGRATDRALGTNTTGTNPGGGTGTGTTGTVPGAGVLNRNTGTDAASGDSNQAVATTSANAPQPAKGANSFSSGEAQRRIESSGYSTVADLKKDDDGVWRGSATKEGAKVNVWLDYKGNIGQN